MILPEVVLSIYYFIPLVYDFREMSNKNFFVWAPKERVLSAFGFENKILLEFYFRFWNKILLCVWRLTYLATWGLVVARRNSTYAGVSNRISSFKWRIWDHQLHSKTFSTAVLKGLNSDFAHEVHIFLNLSLSNPVRSRCENTRIQ